MSEDRRNARDNSKQVIIGLERLSNVWRTERNKQSFSNYRHRQPTFKNIPEQHPDAHAFTQRSDDVGRADVPTPDFPYIDTFCLRNQKTDGDGPDQVAKQYTDNVGSDEHAGKLGTGQLNQQADLSGSAGPMYEIAAAPR